MRKAVTNLNHFGAVTRRIEEEVSERERGSTLKVTQQQHSITV
jgi:hypothetical protein